MKVETLIAIRSDGKKDISSILSYVGLESDALIYVYHYNGEKAEHFIHNGHQVRVCYGPITTKIGAYNSLLAQSNGDVLLFVEPTERLTPGYFNMIEGALADDSKADGVLFGYSKETKRVRFKFDQHQTLAHLCLRKDAVKSINLSFVETGDPAFFDGPVQVFVQDCLSWPLRFIGKTDSLVVPRETPVIDVKNMAFRDARRFGVFSMFLCLPRFAAQKRSERRPVSLFFSDYWEGRRAYLYQGMKSENQPLKKNLLPFVVSCIALLGLATQLVLALLIVFTETQYIPIWVSIIFLIVFVLAYAFSAPKVHNIRATLINGFSAAVAAFLASLITYLSMNASWALSAYGAFVCLAAVLGIMYCFMPSRIARNR